MSLKVNPLICYNFKGIKTSVTPQTPLRVFYERPKGLESGWINICQNRKMFVESAQCQMKKMERGVHRAGSVQPEKAGFKSQSSAR
jgi:hypothetical protein